ncbi:MAG: metal ABC transporter ATP-binding protein [Deltaproteobacteria bacterium]|nr:MAG: metal ABC transporter ATP-binding protein [Deltaproteobacteria bacterium]
MSGGAARAEHALEVRDLTVDRGDVRALEGVSVRIPWGRLVAIVGPNGAGKSTFLQAVLGLVPLVRGEVIPGTGSGRLARRSVVHVPQRSQVDWDFPLTVEDVVRQGRWPWLGLLGRFRDEDRERVEEALVRTGLSALRRRGIDELSGGQQQRMFLARALAQAGELLLLDEPFAGVDASTEEVLLEVLREQRDAGRTVLVVHHDLSTVQRAADDVVILNRELIASGPVGEVLRPDTLARAYGEGLLALGRLAAAGGE